MFILTQILITCTLILLYDIIKGNSPKESIDGSVKNIKDNVAKLESKKKFDEFKNKKGLYEPYRPTGKRESDY